MKKLIVFLFSILIAFSLLNSASANDIKIIDESDVLSDKQEEELSYQINKYIKHTNYDMVIYLTNNRSDYFEKYDDAITRLADDAFDYDGYGVGNNKDGIILCFDTYYRDYTITTHGSDCINAYTDKALNSIYDKVTPCFKDDRFYDGLESFIKESINVYDNYDNYHKSRFMAAVKPSIIGAIIITLLAFWILSSKLKSENIEQNAQYYIKNPKFNILKNGEIFLYSNTMTTRIERSNISSSSSQTHISSSGETHGGGGSHRV